MYVQWSTLDMTLQVAVCRVVSGPKLEKLVERVVRSHKNMVSAFVQCERSINSMLHLVESHVIHRYFDFRHLMTFYSDEQSD